MVNNFLPFANGAAANVDTQAEWVAAASGGYVENGFVAGTASARAANKALRQSTVGVAALATFIESALGQDVLDNGGSAAVTALATQIANAIRAAVQSGAGNYAADTGTVNALVAALSPAPTALTVGMSVRVRAAITNTGAATLNLNGLGAHPVVDEEGNALVAGQIAANSILTYTWDGTSWRVGKPKASTVGGAGSNGHIQFNLNGVLAGSANFFWDNTNGRVGIGVNAPTSRMHIRGDGSAGWMNCGALFENTGVSGRNYSIASRESGKFSIADETGNTERLVISASGNVGLGVGTPQGRLHAYGNVWPLIAAENPSDNASIALKGNSGQACILHYGNSSGGNELRFGRWTSDFVTWQANPVRFDMDAPDGSLIVYGNGNVGCGGTVAASAFYGVGADPIGSTCTWHTPDVPTGWLECNGAAISRTTYAALYAVLGNRYGAGDGSTTFNIPDTRGFFFRGWDHGRGLDPDRASRTNRGDGTTGDNIGTQQDEQLHSHGHGLIGYQWADAGSGNLGLEGNGSYGWTNNTAVQATGGNETRPKNLNVMMIIRAY